jgi:DNA-binding NarL/FixJ family response regulator
VAVALCRPFKAEDTFVRPATNEAIAAELTVSKATVKTHMRALYEVFGLSEVEQSDKRVLLVQHLLTTGAVGDHEL